MQQAAGAHLLVSSVRCHMPAAAEQEAAAATAEPGWAVKVLAVLRALQQQQWLVMQVQGPGKRPGKMLMNQHSNSHRMVLPQQWSPIGAL